MTYDLQKTTTCDCAFHYACITEWIRKCAENGVDRPGCGKRCCEIRLNQNKSHAQDSVDLLSPTLPTLCLYQPYHLTSQELHLVQILMVKIPPNRQHLQRHGSITQSHSQHFQHQSQLGAHEADCPSVPPQFQPIWKGTFSLLPYQGRRYYQ